VLKIKLLAFSSAFTTCVYVVIFTSSENDDQDYIRKDMESIQAGEGEGEGERT
jgi:hypothetical protein